MNKTDQLMMRATAYHKEGQLGEAAKLYTDVIALMPKHIDALRLLGALYLQTQQADEAITTLQSARKLAPTRWDILNNLGTALAFKQRFAEAADAYRQAVKVKPDYTEALNNLGNALRDLGQSDEAIQCYSKVLQQDPKHLPALANLGTLLRAAGRFDDAIQHYQKAAILFPNDFRIFNNLGNLLRESGRAAESIAHYERALQLNPNCVDAYINLGTAQRDLNKVDEAKASLDEALRLKPDSAEAHINYGALHQDSNDKAAAQAHYEKALNTMPDSVDAQWNTALIKLAQGDYSEGWRLHEVGLGHDGKRGPATFHGRRWQGEPLNGKRLLIWSEQGLGDSLQFIRYAEQCKAQGAHVMVLCPASLQRVLATNAHIDEVLIKAREEDYDYHVPMMSLPFMFGTMVDSIPAKTPYLHVSAEYRDKWAAKLPDSDAFKVGLVWAGNPRKGQVNLTQVDKRRSMALSHLMPLLDLTQEAPSLQFYNLQMDEAAKQIDELGLKDKFINPMPHVSDFMDTAAIMDRLDLIISVDTSVVHLAGAMNKPVWVLSRHDACWRWLENREQSPWYPSARVFGQPSPGDWASVVEKVRQELLKQAS